jgi:hypothetical protein
MLKCLTAYIGLHVLKKLYCSQYKYDQQYEVWYFYLVSKNVF